VPPLQATSVYGAGEHLVCRLGGGKCFRLSFWLLSAFSHTDPKEKKIEGESETQRLKRKFREQSETLKGEIQVQTDLIEGLQKRVVELEQEGEATRGKLSWTQLEVQKLRKIATKAAEERDVYMQKYKDMKVESETSRYARDINGPTTEEELREVGLTLSDDQFKSYLIKRAGELKSLISNYQKKNSELEKLNMRVMSRSRRQEEEVELQKKHIAKLKIRLKDTPKPQVHVDTATVEVQTTFEVESELVRHRNDAEDDSGEHGGIVSSMPAFSVSSSASRLQQQRNEKRKRLAADLGDAGVSAIHQTPTSMRRGSNGMGGSHKVYTPMYSNFGGVSTPSSKPLSAPTSLAQRLKESKTPEPAPPARSLRPKSTITAFFAGQ